MLHNREYYAPYVGNVVEYTGRMSFDGQWGGEPELKAASELYGRDIQVFSRTTSPSLVYQAPSRYIIYTRHFDMMYLLSRDTLLSSTLLCSQLPSEFSPLNYLPCSPHDLT